eukprot:7381_1
MTDCVLWFLDSVDANIMSESRDELRCVALPHYYAASTPCISYMSIADPQRIVTFFEYQIMTDAGKAKQKKGNIKGETESDVGWRNFGGNDIPGFCGSCFNCIQRTR